MKMRSWVGVLSSWALSSWVLSSAVLLTACVKREPVVKDATASTPEAAAPSAEEQAAPTGKYGQVPRVDLLGGKGLDAFALAGNTTRVTTSVVDVTGQPFSKAVRAQV
ncbi:MAG: hypothetical protein RL685_3790, partial [Pseudomonadota bacterium]